MSEITIYHTLRCSKSRETPALLEEQGITPVIVEYLKDIPSAETLHDVLTKLGLTPRQLLRTKEDDYKALNLSDTSLSDDALIEAMCANPKLIERPIVIKGKNARIGRPPQQVLEIL